MFAGMTLAASLAMVAAGGAVVDPLAQYRWKSRVLVIIAPSADHPLAVAQHQALAKQKSESAERDLVIVEAIGNSASARSLRQRFKLKDEDARAILIGKDGGDKLTSAEAIGSETLFDEIDAMPMRRDEMRKG